MTTPERLSWGLWLALVVTATVATPGGVGLCASSPAAGSTALVAPNGDDANPGTLERPWRTIQHAADRATPGSTVYVRAGVYDEEVAITTSGLPGAEITFANYGRERPVIDPQFKRQCGFVVAGASFVRIKGFEIRNCRADLKKRQSMGGIVVNGSSATRRSRGCILEENVIHHIIGTGDPKGRAARGISIHRSEGVTVQNNTVWDIVGHTESMGISCDDAIQTIIRRNLVSLCDKEGIRLITQDTDTENVIEANIAIHNHMGIAVNNCRTSRKTIVRNNFCGWNWGPGINPKHTKNVVLSHNTVYGNQRWGIDIHGNGTVPGDNYGPVVKNNILSLNRSAWWILDNEVFGEQVDHNFYHYGPGAPLAMFNWSLPDRCASLADIRQRTAAHKTVAGPYEVHGKEGDPRFVAPERFDFRLKPDSPARDGADDGAEMGASSSELAAVGADRSYGLAHIPDLKELKLTVESYSSEGPSGRAASVVDGSGSTYWEIDLTADAKREIVLALPASGIHEIAYVTIVKPSGPDTYFYRQFRLLVDDGAGDWRPVPEPPEHPLLGYRGLWNGETWLMPPGTKARRVKLRLLSGYGKVIRIPEIRIYARAPES